MNTNNEYIWEALVSAKKHIDGTATIFSQREKAPVLYSIKRAIKIMETLYPDKFKLAGEE